MKEISWKFVLYREKPILYEVICAYCVLSVGGFGEYRWNSLQNT